MTFPFRADFRLRGAAVALAAVLLLCAAAVGFPDFFGRLELGLSDLRFRIAPRPRALPEIVHLDIDDASAARLGTYPFPRRVHARVLEVLARCEPAVVAFDIVFHGAKDEADDAALERAIANLGRVVLPAAFGTVLRDKPIRLDSLDKDEVPVVRSLLAVQVPEISELLQAESSFLPLARFGRQALCVAQITATPDADGVLRRIPLVIGFDGAALPSLALAVAMKFLETKEVRWPDMGRIELVGGRREVSIPLSGHALLPVRFAGPWADTFEHVSYARVFDAADDPDDLEYLHKKLAGRIVLAGLAASGSTDIGPTLAHPAEPKVTVQANAVNAILQGAFIREAHWAFAVLLGLFAIALVGWLWLRLPPRLFLLAGLSLLALLAAANIGLFCLFGVALNLGGTTSLPAVAFLALLGQSFVKTAADNLRQRKMLETYFSPQISRQLLASQSDAFESANRDLTLLFSDIAGFTTLSDTLHPIEVQKILHDYFEAMTEIVFRHQGAVDKFMGDGIMAFWGYPEAEGMGSEDSVKLSALNAVRAAVNMQRTMRELNRKWQAEGREPLAIRIGINTGYVTVGDMGSKRRREFTCIGKNVNLAQRLESNAPKGGVLLSARTYNLVKDQFLAENMGEIKVKGIEKPVQVYAVKID